jgi:hypothetical protein
VVTPAGLMKAQGFDPAPLDLLKAHFFNPDQPRVPAGVTGVRAANGLAARALIPQG